jgi:hypothetical protein
MIEGRCPFALKSSVDRFVERARSGVLMSWPPLHAALPERTRTRLARRIHHALLGYRQKYLTDAERAAFDEMLEGSPYAVPRP